MKVVRKILFVPFIFIIIHCLYSQEKIITRYSELVQSAQKAVQNQDYATALQNYQTLLKLTPYNPAINHHIARMQALLNDPENAILSLKKSIEMGYNITGELDSTLKSLEQLTGFDEVKKLIKHWQRPVSNSHVAYTIPEKNLIPEGIAYDPVDDCFYIGSIWKCKIIKINKDGSVSNFTSEKQDGLREVLGMEVDTKRRILWIASIMNGPRPDIDSLEISWSGIFKYNLTTGELIKKYTIHEPGVNHLLNDVTINSKGDVYISDTDYHAVYTISNERDKLELFLKPDEFLYPNGITIGANDKTLYVTSIGNGVYKIDIPSKRYHMLSQPDNISLYGIDGMYFHQNSLVCVQNGLNRISRFYLNKTGDTVKDMKIIETHNPHFEIPTTGAIAGNKFYYIANSQLRKFNKNGSVFPSEKLNDIVILCTDLNKNSMNDFPTQNDFYFSQEPPGETPEVFAPGIITHGFHELSITISPTNDEMFYIISDRGYTFYALVHLKREKNSWSKPFLANFAKNISVYSCCFTPDGKGLFFSTNRPVKDLDLNTNTWYVEKKKGVWGKAQPIEQPFKSDSKQYVQTISNNNTLLLSRRVPERSYDIFSSAFIENQYQTPQPLKGKVNSKFDEIRPFISPDESYVIFQSDRDSGFGQNDLWISFKEKNNHWSEPINLGKSINTSASDFGPSVTPDGKFLFFSSYLAHDAESFKNKNYNELINIYRSPQNGYATLYWVNAKVIEELKPEHLK